MPRFFLHLINNTAVASDDEGVELTDVSAARDQAIDGIRSVLADEVRRGMLDLRGRIEIAEAGGNVLAVVSFADALEIRTGGER